MYGMFHSPVPWGRLLRKEEVLQAPAGETKHPKGGARCDGQDFASALWGKRESYLLSTWKRAPLRAGEWAMMSRSRAITTTRMNNNKTATAMRNNNNKQNNKKLAVFPFSLQGGRP
jgi:hypothetical protein